MTDKPSDAAATQAALNPDGAGQAMWGGRFTDKPAELMQAINVSIGFDKRLATQDLAGSRAHAAMLRKAGVITSEDEAQIQQGLAAIGPRSRPGPSRSATNTKTST
jgi:argininosuccinate lyase